MTIKHIFARFSAAICVYSLLIMFGCAELTTAPVLETGGTTNSGQVQGLKEWTSAKIPPDYRSPGDLHKVMVPDGASKQTDIMNKMSIYQSIHYQKQKLFLFSKSEYNKLSPSQKRRLTFRDDYNLIKLRNLYFDTTVAQPAVPADLGQTGEDGMQLRLVQFIGPVRDRWRQELAEISGLQIIHSVPENAYLIWTDAKARQALTAYYELKPYVQWHGRFHPGYKLHPVLDLDYDKTIKVTICFVTHRQVNASLGKVREMSVDVLRDAYPVGQHTYIRVEIPASELTTIARFEDVFNIEPWLEPKVTGEIQSQVVAGNLNAGGTGPGGAGYLAWLNGLDINSNFDFAIDISDDGFDSGTTAAASVHPDFLDAAGNSRVIYARRVNGATMTTVDNNNCGGHGTINMAIAGGFNDTPATDPDYDYFADGNNYHFGLGVAPFVQLASSKILDPWSNPDFTEHLDTAYDSGVRINSNSWGAQCFDGLGNKICCGPGVLSDYTAESREFDFLVRDARPSSAASGGEDGNQEMVILFAASNEGTCPDEQLGNNGVTSKNTITVGAGENNAPGSDGCGVGNAGANNINDIINFSSEGPTQDGRVKPDITAPGTHVYGAASQDPCFAGYSVCGSAANDGVAPPADAYFPADPDTTDTRDQDLYTWSSGTSHSCPAVAGGAAVVMQRLMDLGHPMPSPAMVKAVLMGTATHMNGVDANDDLPSSAQGMGRMNLGMALDNIPKMLFDQVKTFYSTAAGEEFVVNGQVADNTRPFRVIMAYTDAPGTPGNAVIRENDLNLEVQVGGNFYRGNDFTLGVSNAGNIADPADDTNNIESVFLPAGQSGNFTVTVRPATIDEDGVPNNVDGTDQDVALMIYNAEFPARAAVDIVLVLDRSGSMNDPVPGGTVDKLDLLKDAVEMFVRSWEPYAIAGDRMAVVYFNNELTTYPSPATLLDFQPNARNIIDHVRSITATRCTGMGGGVKQAYDLLSGSANPKIVVFSDGMQNCTPSILDDGSGDLVLKNDVNDCSNCNHAALVPAGTQMSLSATAIPIYTIGTGVNGGSAWWTLMGDIASQTAAVNHFTSMPDEDLEDFFLDTLVSILAVDPVQKVGTHKGTIARTDPIREEAFQVDVGAREISFALSWRGEKARHALKFRIFAPNGVEIDPKRMFIRDGEFYRVAALKFPYRQNGQPINPGGIWKLRIEPNMTVPHLQYSAHVIIDTDKLQFHFDAPRRRIAVGEGIPLHFWMQDQGRTLSHIEGKILATIKRPPTGYGTFLSTHHLDEKQFSQSADPKGDGFANEASEKAYWLLKNEEIRKKLSPVTDHVMLYDDGKPEHGDVRKNDGVYSAFYKKTQYPGVYNVDLTVLGQIPKVGAIGRKVSQTVIVGMETFSMAKSEIKMTKVKPITGVVAYEVGIKLVDQYGNYFGPGNELAVAVIPPGKHWGRVGRKVLLEDQLNGTYKGRVELARREAEKGYRLVLDANGMRVWRLDAER